MSFSFHDHKNHKTKKTNTRSVLSIALFITGVLLLGYCAKIYLLDGFFKPEEDIPPPPSSTISSSAPSSLAPSSAPSEPDLFPTDEFFISPERGAYVHGDMILRVPRLNLETPVLNGVSDAVLAHGVGLYDFAALPGEKKNSNVSIAGHRDIHGMEFYSINKITKDDLFYLKYKDKQYTYEYENTEIVPADDWGPIYSKDFSCLTLTSCDPIGTSLNRIIITARLIDVSDL